MHSGGRGGGLVCKQQASTCGEEGGRSAPQGACGVRRSRAEEALRSDASACSSHTNYVCTFHRLQAPAHACPV
eukprot:353454-Chlamydomonas_euryale.AAC.3